MMIRKLLLRFAALGVVFPGLASGGILDTLVFGRDVSESRHELSARLSDFKSGGPGGVSKVAPRTTVVIFQE